jgi:RimJ/RimL family protein N-acetyltransferase
MTQNYLFKSKRLGFHLLKPEEMSDLESMDHSAKMCAFFPEHLHNVALFVEKINQFIAQYRLHGLPCFAIHELHSHQLVGVCGFIEIGPREAEVGYLFHKEAWGNGFSAEALIALIDWARQNVNMDYVVGYTLAEHVAAQRIMEKAGMRFFKRDHVDGVEYRYYHIQIKP